MRRRASTPLPVSYRPHLGTPDIRPYQTEVFHPQLAPSSSCEPRDRVPEQPCPGWSSESSDSEESWESLYRVVLLGDPGVGKTSLVNLFAGVQDKDLLEQQRGRNTREERMVDLIISP